MGLERRAPDELCNVLQLRSRKLDSAAIDCQRRGTYTISDSENILTFPVLANVHD